MIVEVYPSLFVGDDDALVQAPLHQLVIVHAAKEPYHRQAVGYRGRALPSDHPEYLFAFRENELALNMVDTDNPMFFSRKMIGVALEFVHHHYSIGHCVLIHCNKGLSRSPSLALLYLAAYLKVLPHDSLEEAEDAFLARYPLYNPKRGIRSHLQTYWLDYCGGGTPKICAILCSKAICYICLKFPRFTRRYNR